jgi:hypothetical protein
MKQLENGSFEITPPKKHTTTPMDTQENISLLHEGLKLEFEAIAIKIQTLKELFSGTKIESIKGAPLDKNTNNKGKYVVLPRLTRNAIEASSVDPQRQSIDINYKHGDLMANMPQTLFSKGYISYEEAVNQGYDIKQLRWDVATLNQAYEVPGLISSAIGPRLKKEKKTLEGIVLKDLYLSPTMNKTLFELSTINPQLSPEENLNLYEQKILEEQLGNTGYLILPFVPAITSVISSTSSNIWKTTKRVYTEMQKTFD